MPRFFSLVLLNRFQLKIEILQFIRRARCSTTIKLASTSLTARFSSSRFNLHLSGSYDQQAFSRL
jgi:hypothetical protein